jgi:hypothetical protein
MENTKQLLNLSKRINLIPIVKDYIKADAYNIISNAKKTNQRKFMQLCKIAIVMHQNYNYYGFYFGNDCYIIYSYKSKKWILRNIL